MQTASIQNKHNIYDILQVRVDSLDAKLVLKVDTYKFVNFFLDFVSITIYFRYIKYCLGT